MSKSLNVKSKGKVVRHSNKFETVINDKIDLQLNLFLEFKNMTKKVKNMQKKNDLKSKVQKLHETYISST